MTRSKPISGLARAVVIPIAAGTIIERALPDGDGVEVCRRLSGEVIDRELVPTGQTEIRLAPGGRVPDYEVSRRGLRVA